MNKLFFLLIFQMSFCPLLSSQDNSIIFEKRKIRIDKQDSICKKILYYISNEKYNEAMSSFESNVNPDLKSVSTEIKKIKSFSYPLGMTIISNGKFIVKYTYNDIKNDKICYLGFEFTFDEKKENYKIEKFKMLSKKDIDKNERDMKKFDEIPPPPP